MGRPAHPQKLTRKPFGLPDEMWEEVSGYRHEQRIPSEVEAIRRLMRAGLDAEATRLGADFSIQSSQQAASPVKAKRSKAT